jgi:hypothetical protein
LAGEPDRSKLCLAGQELSGGLRTIQQTTKDIQSYRTEAKLPPEAGFLKVDGDVVVTSMRSVGDGLEVRLFNPNLETVDAAIDLSQRPAGTKFPKKAWLVDFESNRVGAVDGFDGRMVKLTVPPKKIQTVHME